MRWTAIVICSTLGLGRTHIASSQTVLAGDSLRVRFLTPASGAVRSPIRAVTIAPLRRDDRVVVPPGAVLLGAVDSAGLDGRTRQRWLAVHFDRLLVPLASAETAQVAIRARLRGVDNARERVSEEGLVVGPPSSSLVRSRRAWVLFALGSLHPVGALAAAAILEVEERARHREIVLAAGFEGAVTVLDGAVLPGFTDWRAPPALAIDTAAEQVLSGLPRRSNARVDGTPADPITIVLIGTADQVRGAFRSAGWDSSGGVSLRTDFATFARAARAEGYVHQPVSANYVDGRLPAFVFQKLADTFVKRHHLRIWQAPATWDGVPVWLVAASRDVGITFSTARRTFAHRTDPRIDNERDGVVNDLVAAGRVEAFAMFARPELLGLTVNDGQSPIVSDWRLAVVRLR